MVLLGNPTTFLFLLNGFDVGVTKALLTVAKEKIITERKDVFIFYLYSLLMIALIYELNQLNECKR